jgi:hypothetical protein
MSLDISSAFNVFKLKPLSLHLINQEVTPKKLYYDYSIIKGESPLKTDNLPNSRNHDIQTLE